MQIQITLSSLSELEQLRDFLAGQKTPVTVENTKTEETKTEETKAEETTVDHTKPIEIKAEAVKSTSDEPISVGIRKVIQQTRERLGDDGSDAALRRGVNTELRNIATSLGFDKPSAINTQEAFESFKTAAADIIIDNGKVKTQLPF